ncbi:PHP domain-containing protein [Actinoplanes sp. LDG1-06]|uniref:PHP domain-containing protein n=1 Tax=Paractinoplanes ovalisporus TaxID=2810368 RepID=A0ABS2AMA5_9ACTN|nr:PHP domain-containing protein [Actinoplanes ovalisporus]MBM2620964.1 PHP domain-containing protein [Actinoplanes ovalisporus]
MRDELPADSHVHSEWSWDTPIGDMEATCARAVELGVPAVAFTEHLDHIVWTADRRTLEESPHLASFADGLGQVTAPPFDAVGYLAAIERCRQRFPDLRVLSGLEIGEPHLHTEAVARVLSAGRFDRVLGSMHALPIAGEYYEPPGMFEHYGRVEAIRRYLLGIPAVVAGSDVFAVFAHIDYPVRFWPVDAEPFDPYGWEEEFRLALRAVADGGRVLEVNSQVPLHPEILRWWREEGGDAVSFGSDAHDPTTLAGGFREVAHMVEAHGFRPGREPHDFWTR